MKKMLIESNISNFIKDKLGVDFCVEEPFNAEFAAKSADEFFHEFLLKTLHAKVVIVGQDFAFGRKREGNTELLKEYCKTYLLSICNHSVRNMINYLEKFIKNNI
jgi:riboflavin kinase/FMN adenylyltransferase